MAQKLRIHFQGFPNPLVRFFAEPPPPPLLSTSELLPTPPPPIDYRRRLPISNLVLDVSNFKESKLLHLVWRKYPRNCRSPEGMTTINSSSTQTEESLYVGLLKHFTMMGNSFAPDKDRNSAADNIREFSIPMIRPCFLIRDLLVGAIPRTSRCFRRVLLSYLHHNDAVQ